MPDPPISRRPPERRAPAQAAQQNVPLNTKAVEKRAETTIEVVIICIKVRKFCSRIELGQHFVFQ
jgi:hypothetical protein